MSSTTTQVMSVRVKNETAEFFKGKPLNRVVENVHEMSKSGEIAIEGDGRVVIQRSDDKCEGNSI